ncbi:MAG: methionyl-tRNA formyltransferase [Flavobacteriaceae bacterium]|nr:methionyl-tRNA formyltransferase [Flavobacteriaceae bacterium]NNK72617.1 methionyl-tRNA formyltransferase [Flavobacteriaceae bacterium]
MKRELNIIFMGTPEFAVSSLEALIENHYKVVAVVTAPDKPAGRGRKMNTSAVKQYALSKGLTVLQPKRLKNEYFLKVLQALHVNLIVVVAFRMLPESVWRLPKYGTFNLHASLLPQYRGAAPINWAIINGETQTGVTTFFIDDKIDTGELILKREVEIDADETAGSLHDKLKAMGSQLVIETVKLIEQDDVSTKPQSENSELKSAPKLNPENCKIEWQKSQKAVNDLIRGLSPYPAAWCILKNGEETQRIKIYKAERIESENKAEAGSIQADKKSLLVACDDGWISILELQLAGKRKMDIKSLLNGYAFASEAKML